MQTPLAQSHTILNLPVVVSAILLMGISAEHSNSTVANEKTVKVTTGKSTHVGKPVAWDSRYLMLLRRDGRMLEVPMSNVTAHSTVANSFQPYSSKIIQNHLQKIFSKYEVSRTAHYVVVHPPGMRAQWADQFERLYGRFHQYFRVRNFTVREPEFPMVVVVFNTRSEFNSVARKAGMTNPNGYVGYYSPESNWVVTYQQQNSHYDGQWESNYVTLIHEALHQFAFNTGIHNRWAPTPKWSSEGLANMFEARGVNYYQRYTADSDRLHEVYLPYLQDQVANGKTKGRIAEMISSDRFFVENPDLAYALSWGLAFYLAETRRRHFFEYLQTVAARPAFQDYSSADRQRDFAAFFGNRIEVLETQFEGFILQQ